jgi:tetratricopeptide (TPR) repeat protein
VGLEKNRVVRTAVSLGRDLYNLGSGYLIADRLVLTAAHVLMPAEGVLAQEGQAAEVERIDGAWEHATVAWVDAVRDVGVLSCPELRADSMVRWGRLAGSKRLDWDAVGFPVASIDPEKGRQPEHAFGWTSPISEGGAGRLALTIRSRQPARGDSGKVTGGDSPWAGLSGAAVFCGDHLAGVVTTDPRAYEKSVVGRRAEDFCQDPAFAQLLGRVPVLENVTGSTRDHGLREVLSGRQPKVFLSHLTADTTWVDWIEGLLGQAGFTVARQRWHFVAGADLDARAQQSLADNECVMVLLSAAFIASPHSGNVWLRQLMGQQIHQRVVLVRVEPCKLPDWLSPHVTVDFVGVPPSSAVTQILEELEARGFAPGRKLPAASRAQFVRDFPGRGPAISNLPPRNEIFTDRVKILGRIQKLLLSEPNAGKMQACTLHGLGGIGKTQAAIEFGHRFGSHYDLVWWIRAEQQVSITDHLMWLARELRIDQAAEQSFILNALWQELKRRDRWLLIFDNAPNANALKPFWPRWGNGDVLVTSRYMAWKSLGGIPVRLQSFSARDAVTFLQKRTSKTGEGEAARTVAERLGFLPLALEQAGAYVEETQTSLRAYSELLPGNQQALLAAGKPGSYPGTVASTWRFSIDAAREEQPHARDLLALFAYLAPDDIPRDLVPDHAEALQGPLAGVAADPVRYDQILAALTGFSLVDADPERIGIHRLVQDTVRSELDPGDRVLAHGEAVRLMTAAFPEDPYDMRTWPACGRLLAHVGWVVQDYQELLPGLAAELGVLLQRAGRYLHVRGDFPEAQRFLEQALDVRRSQPGKDRTPEAETLSTLGRVYYHLAVLDKARPATEEAIRLYQEELGEDALQATQNMLHLSRIVREIGEFSQAEHLALEFLHTCARAHAGDQGMLAAGHSTLGDALWRLGRLEEARASYREALRLRQGSAGATPADTASCHKHIGIVSIELNDYQTAEEELLRARELLSAAYEEDNLDLVDVDLHRGDLLCRSGRPGEARIILERVVQVRERILGKHPDLAGALVKYSVALTALGEYPEAIKKLQRASVMFAACSGTGHPYVADAEFRLAETLRKDDRLARARTAAKQAFEIYRAAYGSDHPSTIQAQTLLRELSRDPDSGEK